MEKRFEAEIRHTEETVRLMFKTEYATYSQMRLLTRMLIGFLMVAAALTAGLPMVAQGVLLLAGCWLMISRDFPGEVRADRTLEARGGSLPTMDYTFYDDRIVLTGEGAMDLPYSRLHRLVEDRGYLYLFLGKKSVCMIDKATVTPGTAEELKAFVAGRTGLTWRQNKSFLSMNLMDLLQARRDRRLR